MIHLNCRTSYSFQRGYGTVKEWDERAEQIGSRYVVADYCSTWAHPFFAGHAGLGVQLPVVGTLAKEPSHALGTIIPFNREGLEALYALVTLAHQQTYYRPRVTWEQIKDHMSGHGTLIIDAATPLELSQWTDHEFGFIGVGTNKTWLWTAAKEYAAVVAPGAQYPGPQDRKLYEIVKSIGAGHRAGERDAPPTHMLGKPDLDLVLREHFDMDKLWGLTETLGEMIDEVHPASAGLIDPKHLPSLDDMVQQGIRDRFASDELPEAYQERLSQELAVIREKKFDDYFRFVADVVQWSKERFLVGPGRGSSGGSLLCYLIGITDLDPMVHGTMFARFIDPGRPDLPDIDVDFPDVRRDEVFEYLRETYGQECVAKLGTVSEWHAPSAINDVARVEEVDRDDARALKNLAEGTNVPLSVLCSTVDDAKAILERNPALAWAFDLENKPRHSGVHAAGVLVLPDPAHRFGAVSSQSVLSVDGNSAERLGLLKFDALGLRTLTVIQETIEIAGLEPTDYHNILSEISSPTDNDEKVWKVFQEDRVTGIFQFEGEAVRNLARKITVDRFSDLCALSSLARPGPLYTGQADMWCAARMGEADVEMMHPALDQVTAETYGQIVYQEQAMALTATLAGFDDSQVNKFRKAMGKKVPEDLAAMREQFVEGCMKKSAAGEIDIEEQQANEIFDRLEEYSGYAFNKSHAVAYSMITYVTAWLKAHYPMEFACAHLRHQVDEKKCKGLLRDLTAEGIEYVPFDIDKSDVNWSIKEGIVYGGFTAVRGIGQKTAEACIRMRDGNPDGWKRDLTAAQRGKLLVPYNTPWHDLTRMSEQYGKYYSDPTLIGVRRERIWQIDDIPEQKGTYVFIGKLIKAVERQNKNGKFFINLYFEDDSGECGCTINQYKASGWKHMLEADQLNQDYLVRADIIEDGRKWFFFDKLKEL